ncbi:CD3324 family protein [Enterococcus sp. AZ109]|uniref:CD3324 family protein n=1 Tax=Enterococcus sp. AZ109 TaxID=2774634 RepID=UPI003F25ADC9
MKYHNANVVLPKSLVVEIQKYLQGEYLYIPAQKEKRKAWGECSGFRKEMDIRNQKITKEYQSGKSIEELADSYYLSTHSIKKIVYKKI